MIKFAKLIISINPDLNYVTIKRICYINENDKTITNFYFYIFFLKDFVKFYLYKERNSDNKLNSYNKFLKKSLFKDTFFATITVSYNASFSVLHSHHNLEKKRGRFRNRGIFFLSEVCIFRLQRRGHETFISVKMTVLQF